MPIIIPIPMPIHTGGGGGPMPIWVAIPLAILMTGIIVALLVAVIQMGREFGRDAMWYAMLMLVIAALFIPTGLLVATLKNAPPSIQTPEKPQ
jgi:hypothetical protein